MELVLQTLGMVPGQQAAEVVERKGLGHPDTVCDAIAEQVCVRLCQYYLEHFGVILHHNVDKVLLVGGCSRPEFGGGEIVEPIELYLAGRATGQLGNTRIPVQDIAVAACREWIERNLPELDVDRHVRIIPRLRPGSADLTRLFARSDGVALANDTSCGTGFAPFTDLERAVLQAERQLNSAATKRSHPEIGSDIKVMGVRTGERIVLTIGCAFVARHVSDMHDYKRKKERVRELVLSAARQVSDLELEASVNVADDFARGDVFLTVSGTSAEAGDDGEVGRGNRTSGLITPYRPMSLEAAAGKNPLSHVGKLYQVIATRISGALTDQLPSVRAAECLLVSQIGRPIDDPQLVDIWTAVDPGTSATELRQAAEDIVRGELATLESLRDELLRGEVGLF